MAEIILDYSGVSSSLDELKEAYKKMYDYSGEISNVSNKLKGCIDTSVITTLNKTSVNTEEIALNIKELRHVLKEILKKYKRTENDIKKTDIGKDRISDPSKFDTYWETAFWQAVYGDFTDEGNMGGMLLSVLIGLVPILGQLADIRDIIANISGMTKDGVQSDEVVGLIFSVIGLIPGADAFKSLGKFGGKVADVTKGFKNADKFDDIAELTKGVAKKGQDVYKAIDDKIDDLLNSKKYSKVINDLRKEIMNKSDEIHEAIAQGNKYKKVIDKSIKFTEDYIHDLIDKYLQNEVKEKISAVTGA